MKQLWAWLNLDRSDFMLALGLAALGVGLSHWFAWTVGLTACGGVIILFCLIGALRSGG